jgi:glycine cleavage system H protein
MYPGDYRYTKAHEWIKVDGSVGTVGITDYAQHELGDVVFAELPTIGVMKKAGESFGTVEIYTPVSGEITEINSKLVDAPETINKDPHGTAWLVKIRLSNPKELSSLMDAAAYEAYIAAEAKGH